jgi:hypothetical protein
MDIIFAKLPKYLDPLSIVIRKLGYRIYYLELAHNLGDSKKAENLRVAKLKKFDILPLSIEDLPHFTGFSEMNGDTKKIAFQRTRQIVPEELLDAFGQLFPDIQNIKKKLQIGVHSAVALQMLYITGKINLWACANQDKKYLFIDVSPDGWLSPEMPPNVRLLVIPLDILAKGFDRIIHIFYTFLHLLHDKFAFYGRHKYQIDSHELKINNHSRVAFVVHNGLNYGKLYQKDLFYSPKIDSEFHPERLLHIDYNGWTSPSEKLTWVCMRDHRQSWKSNTYSALVALNKGILQIRRFRHILGLLILIRFYVIFRSFSTKLEAFPDLRMALIDYEILCPKELLLAFENKGIQTVAVQERFILTFNNLIGSTILNHYFTSSEFCTDIMRKSPFYAVDNYLPVGQYRSDKLVKNLQSHLPRIVEPPRAKGLKIVTALGYHTHTEWQNSQVDPLLNWRAHQHFLDDMIRLSKDIPDIFIILRYKNVDWISLPTFAETVHKIKSSDNIMISIEYKKSFESYDLCAHSDLVIAKHTSLADECLSVGIPVLFHEYTHNVERLVADIFDYKPTKILCFNYQELLERTKIILSDKPKAMNHDYDYLKREIFGGLGDGYVKERIHEDLKKLLSGG